MRCVHAGGRRSAATGTAAADDSIKAAVTAGAPAAQRIRRARRLMRSLRDSSGAVQRDGGAGPGGGAGAAAISGSPATTAAAAAAATDRVVAIGCATACLSKMDWFSGQALLFAPINPLSAVGVQRAGRGETAGAAEATRSRARQRLMTASRPLGRSWR